MNVRLSAAVAAFAIGAFAAACTGGGGGGGSSFNPGSTPTPTPAPTNGSQSTQQVIKVALPTTAIGTENDPTYGMVGGFTANTYSQVLGFAPGSQVMIANADNNTPHTLGDTGGHGSFPSNGAALSTTASGGTTFSNGFQTGALNPGQSVGPITLSAGTYYIGCAFHYSTNSMRDVLVVAASATPGPQGTPPPGASPAPSGNPGSGGFGGY
jgi:hypothetical protein